MSDTITVDSVEQPDLWGLLNATEQLCDALEAQLAERDATIAALREALTAIRDRDLGQFSDDVPRPMFFYTCERCEENHATAQAALAQPIPPAAKRLLALSALLEDRAWWRDFFDDSVLAADLLAAINARMESGA